MAGAWVLAAVLATAHAVAFREYVAMLTRSSQRTPPAVTAMHEIVPTNYADAQTWVRYALTFDQGAPWQVRYTFNDNAPAGREVHWNSGFAHAVAAGGRLRRAFTGEELSVATERMLPWFNLPVLLGVIGLFSAWVGRRAGAGAGALVALGMVGTESFYGGFSPDYVDHHGLLTAATFGIVLGALFMGGGWRRREAGEADSLLPHSPQAARQAAIFSAVCGAVGMWFSAATTIPAIALTGLAGLAAAWVFGPAAQREGAEFDASLWRLWGRVGAAVSVVFYLLEYAPTHFGMRLEVNQPFHALAWWGGSEIVALLAEYRLARGPRRLPAAWRLAWPLVAVGAAPVAILLGGTKVFVVSDPFVSEIPKTVAEGLSLAAMVKLFGRAAFFNYVNWNIVPFFVVAGLLAVRRQREKALLLFSGLIALGFFGMLLAQVRWGYPASGPLLALLLVVAIASLAGRSQQVRWATVAAIAAVCFLPIALGRIRDSNRAVQTRSADRMDLQQLLYRDAAAAIRASQPTGDIVLLASPNGSSGMGYYGNFKTIGTLYWENYVGMRTAAEIFGAPTEEKAREMVRAHGITHIALITEESFLPQFYSILHPGSTPEELRKSFGFHVLADLVLPAWLRPIPYRPPADVLLPNLRVILLQVVPDQNEATALWHIALAQLALGENNNAAQSFEASVMKAPAAERVQLCLTAGNRCYERGAHDAAVRMFRDALTAGPNAVALSNLVWLLATSKDDTVRNGQEALTLSQQLKPEDASSLTSIAAALAEVGRFPEAVAACTQALERVKAAGDKAAAEQLTKRLELYRAGKPWHQ